MAKTKDKDGNSIDFKAFLKQVYDEILKGKPLSGEESVLQM